MKTTYNAVFTPLTTYQLPSSPVAAGYFRFPGSAIVPAGNVFKAAQ
jgi:hypothetical protein